MTAITRAFLDYVRIGFDPIPLRPQTKRAFIRNWPTLTPDQMWRNIPANVNIGIRCGGRSNLCVIDCDEEKRRGTYDNAFNWLAGMGYLPGDYPVIKTASGIGRHIYVYCKDMTAGNSCQLEPSFGAGEYRFGPGAYVVAPPSKVLGKYIYLLLSGDFRRLPILSQTDISPIIQRKSNDKLKKPKRIPRRTLALLKGSDA